jgi:hypothetical protein
LIRVKFRVLGKEKGRKGREHEHRPALSVPSLARGEERREEALS